MIVCDQCGCQSDVCYVYHCCLKLTIDSGSFAVIRCKDHDTVVSVDLCLDCAKVAGERLRSFIRKEPCE